MNRRADVYNKKSPETYHSRFGNGNRFTSGFFALVFEVGLLMPLCNVRFDFEIPFWLLSNKTSNDFGVAAREETRKVHKKNS